MGLTVHFSSDLVRFEDNLKVFGFGFKNGKTYFFRQFDSMLEEMLIQLLQSWFKIQEISIIHMPYLKMEKMYNLTDYRIFICDTRIHYNGPRLGEQHDNILERFLSQFTHCPDQEKIIRYFYLPGPSWQNFYPIKIWAPMSAIKDWKKLSTCPEDLVDHHIIPKIFYILKQNNLKSFRFKNFIFYNGLSLDHEIFKIPRIRVTTNFMTDWLTYHGHMDNLIAILNTKILTEY